MPTPANTAVLDLLERGQILTGPQLEEAKTVLRDRCPDPKSLAQELLRRGWITSYQARQLGSGRGADLLLENYLLLEPLGMGGTGQVFKARHRKMGRLVAFKVLRPDVVKDSEIVQRFYREIEVASQLSHPNIVHAYEAGPIGASLVLIMEYVEGTDLERLVQQSGPLPVPRACDYVRQAAVGLQYAYERGLVHRDIKPSNLLVTKPGPGKTQLGNVIKILDLGLARLQQPVRGSRTANLTVLGGNTVMQGTPDYMAPEQALDFHKADSLSDIYSLGCTFYFLLAGQPPFPGGTLAEKLLKHQLAVARPIEEMRSDVPPAVAAVLRRLMAKQPADRFPTAGDIAGALGAFVQPGTLARTLPGEGDTTLWDKPFAQKQADQPPAAPARKRRRLLLYALAGAGLLVLLLVLTLARSNRGENQEAVRQSGTPAGSSESTPPDPTLVGHWRLDEGSGTSANDSSGKGSHGTLEAGAAWAPGRIGGAAALDGRGAFIDYGASPTLNFADKAAFTFAGWVSTRAGFGPIISQRSSTSTKPVIAIVVGFDGAGMDPGRLMALVRDDTHVSEYARVTGGMVNDGQWHHFALVRSGNAVSLYLDGALQGSSAKEGAGGPITTNLRAFGTDRAWLKDNFGQPQQRFLQGAVDDVRIYHRALSASEIAALAKP